MPNPTIPPARASVAPILDADDHAAILVAANIVRGGGLVILPTDTVYGVAASLDHPDALARIFAGKARAAGQTLPILLGSTVALARVAGETGVGARRLMNAFWPGAMTIVIPARDGLPAAVVGPGNTVGVRVPADRSARTLIDLAGGALAVTSANRSGHPPALDARDAGMSLGDWVNAIIDGGPMVGDVASTVVRATGDRPEIVRAGAVSEADIVAVWDGAYVLDEAPSKLTTGPG